MNTPGGFLLDQWGALVMGGARHALFIDKVMETNLRARNLPNTTIGRGQVTLDGRSLGGQYRPALIVSQKLGRGGSADVYVSVTRTGIMDLDMAWAVCAKNDLNQISGNAAGVLGLVTGAAFVLSGAIVSMMGVPNGDMAFGGMLMGSSMWHVGDKSYPTLENERAALELAHIVDFCLMRAVSARGIDANQLRVYHAAKNIRIGHLANG